jgi:hypothetical protein
MRINNSLKQIKDREDLPEQQRVREARYRESAFARIAREWLEANGVPYR